MKKGLLALLLLMCSFFNANAVTYYSEGNLAPNTLANWNSNRDGTSGSTPGNFTTSGDIFIIQGTGGGAGAPHTMTSGSTMTFGAGVTLEVEAGATLSNTSNITFNATATFKLDANSFFIQNSTSATGISAGVENWDATATITYTKTGYISTANITGGAHPNVVVSTGGNANFAGVITNIAGNLTMNNAGFSLTLTGATAMTLSIGGNLNLTAGTTFSLGNGTATPVVNLAGNLTIASGITFTYNGSGAQGSLNFTKSGTQTFSNSGTMAATPVNYTVNNGSTLDVGTSVISGTGTFTVASGGGIKTAHLSGISTTASTGSVQVTGTKTYNTGGNYTFNGAAAQATGNGFTGAATLTINNSSGVSLSAAAAVTGTLTFTSGKLDLGANNLTLTSATVSGATSSNYFIAAGAGKILRSITSGGGSFVFPIGRSSSTYNPVTITNTGGATSIYTVGVAATSYTPSNDGANAQWSIASGTSTTSTFAFTWTTADAGANLTGSPASGNVYSYNGSSWGTTGGTTTGTPNVTTESGITSANTIWTVAMPAAVPDIALADNVGGQVAAGTITKNTTNNIIYNFQLGVTTANATLSSVAFATTNASGDVTNYKLYYASSNSFGSASQIGSSITTSTGTGTHTFSSLSQAVNSGSTGYFWIVSDVPTGATPGNTIVVTAITTSDITFASGNKTGSTSTGGTQTIIAAPTVTTGSATVTGTTTVTLNGTVSANAATTTNTFIYSTDNSYGSSASASPSTTSGQSVSITASLSSLPTNTLYNFKAQGSNSVGTVAGSAAQFTTRSNAPTIGSATSITAGGFTANWTAPTNDGSEAYTYTVEADDDNAFGSIDASQGSVSGTSQALSGLSAATTYYFRVKAVNAGGSSAYSSNGSFTTYAAEPTTASTSLVFSNITTNSLDLSWTSGNGANRIVVVKDGSAPTAPTDATSYTANAAFGSGNTTASGSYVVYNGSSNTVSVTSLTQGHTYYVTVYEYNGTTGIENYLTSSSLSGNQIILSTEPTSAATAVNFTSVAGTAFTINWTNGDGANRVVLVKDGGAVNSDPVDGTGYTANSVFTSGD